MTAVADRLYFETAVQMNGFLLHLDEYSPKPGHIRPSTKPGAILRLGEYWE